jgi:hypothetical protein
MDAMETATQTEPRLPRGGIEVEPKTQSGSERERQKDREREWERKSGIGKRGNEGLRRRWVSAGR